MLMLATPVSALHAEKRPVSFAELEDHLSQALAAYDRAAVDRLFDDRLVFVFPNGRIADKAERLKGMVPPAASAGSVLTSHNDSVEGRYQDDHMAVVLVRSSWRQGETAQGRPYLATHVWLRSGSEWRLVAAQVAQVAP